MADFGKIQRKDNKYKTLGVGRMYNLQSKLENSKEILPNFTSPKTVLKRYTMFAPIGKTFNE